MEYTDYYVAKGTPAALRDKLSGLADKGIIVEPDGELVPFVVADPVEEFDSKWDWLLSVFDAEGAAWGFRLIVDGDEVASATYGDNAEWGIDRSDNGFEGDVDQVSAALGTTVNELKACMNDEGAVSFCKAVGFNHQYMLYPHEHEMPDGIVLMSDLM